MTRKRVVLRDTRDAQGTRFLEASINSEGGLVIEGQDIGPGVEEIFGVSEYEWAWAISARDCNRLRVALGTKSDLLSALGERFAGERASDLLPFLESEGIRFTAWGRMGD